MRSIINKIVIFYGLFIVSTLYVMENQKALQPFAIQYQPWRAQYKPEKLPEDCVFCSLYSTDQPAEKYLLHKGQYCYVALNTNPYISDDGHHLLLIPYKHKKHYTQLSAETQQEMDCITHYIGGTLSSQTDELHISFHIGTNALASIPNHIHQHIICKTTPRCFNLPEAIERSTAPTDLTVQYQRLLPLFARTIVPLYCISSGNNGDPHCYYCTILQQNNDQRNLIIYKNEQVTALFDHHSPFTGDIIIIPNNHYTCKQHITITTLTAMQQLVLKIYPLLLAAFNTDDINVGMISYGHKSTNKQHIRYQITPRPCVPSISPITHTAYIGKNIPALLEQLKKEFMQ